MTLLQGSKSRKKTNFVLTNHAFFYRSTLKKNFFYRVNQFLQKQKDKYIFKTHGKQWMLHSRNRSSNEIETRKAV